MQGFLVRRIRFLLPKFVFPFLIQPFSTIKFSSGLSSSDSEDVKDPNHIFVSKHFEIDNDQIFTTLRKFKLDYKQYPSGQIAVKYCPICPKPHNNEKTNMFSLNIKPQSGAFFCFRCSAKGSWIDFKNMLYNGVEQGSNFDFNQMIKPVGFDSKTHEYKLANEGLAYLRHRNLEAPEFDYILKYLIDLDGESRCLDLEILKKYKVGAGIENFADENGDFQEVPVVYFPMFAPRSKKDKQKLLSEKVIFDENSFSNIDYYLVRNKIRGIYKKNKIYQRMDPAPGYW